MKEIEQINTGKITEEQLKDFIEGKTDNRD